MVMKSKLMLIKKYFCFVAVCFLSRFSNISFCTFPGWKDEGILVTCTPAFNLTLPNFDKGDQGSGNLPGSKTPISNLFISLLLDSGIQSSKSNLFIFI